MKVAHHDDQLSENVLGLPFERDPSAPPASVLRRIGDLRTPETSMYLRLELRNSCFYLPHPFFQARGDETKTTSQQ